MSQAQSKNDRCRIEWDALDHQGWDSLLDKVYHSNILQSWAYGEAKRCVQRCCVRRGVIFIKGQIAGIVQAIEFNIPFVGTIVRINRGPLFLGGDLPDDMLRIVYTALKNDFRWYKRKMLLIAPELACSDSNLVLLRHMGFIKRSSEPGYCSARINLTATEAELRNRLQSKWRNMVAFAERAGLIFEKTSEETHFLWLMQKYEEMMRSKGFNGPSVEMMNRTRSSLMDKEECIIMRALYRKKPVAGILVCGHGLTSTYLVGWNGMEGRSLKANNYLLWNALVEMKRDGYNWFDVGGVDERNTPEITRFKRGLMGKEYTLAGEFLSC